MSRIINYLEKTTTITSSIAHPSPPMYNHLLIPHHGDLLHEMAQTK